MLKITISPPAPCSGRISCCFPRTISNRKIDDDEAACCERFSEGERGQNPVRRRKKWPAFFFGVPLTTLHSKLGGALAPRRDLPIFLNLPTATILRPFSYSRPSPP